MFQLDNQVTGERSEFDNRSSFLYAIETLEKRLLATNQSAPYVMKHLDKDGRVLESRELVIPQRDGTDSVDVLADFGFQKASKKPKQRSKDKSQIVPPPKAFKGEKETSLTNVTSRRRLKWVVGLYIFFMIMTILVSIIALLGISKQAHKTQATSTVSSTMTRYDHSADVFCRYFISAYYAKSSNLSSFVASSVASQKLEPTTSSPNSVLLESEKTAGKIQTLTYVLSSRESDGQVKSIRLTLTLKQAKEATYGYLLVKAPQLSPYPH